MKKLICICLFIFFVLNIYAYDTEIKSITEKTKKYNIEGTYELLKPNSSQIDTINKKIEKEILDGVKELKEESDKEISKNYLPLDFRILNKDQITLYNSNLYSSYIHYYFNIDGDGGFRIYDVYNYEIKDNKLNELTIKDIFGDKINKLPKMLNPLYVKEKQKRNDENFTMGKEPINTDNIILFTMDPFGINFIFNETVLGPSAEGDYVFSLSWEQLKKFVVNKTVLDYINNEKARVNISGNIMLNDNGSVPSNSKVMIKLIWIPLNKSPKVLETKEIMLLKGQREIPFKNSYDFTKLNDGDEYQILTELYFNGVLAYKNRDELPITYQGWSQDNDIIVSPADKDFIVPGKDTSYMRLISKITLPDENYPLDGYIEFLLSDKNNKTLDKQFIKYDTFPYMFDIVFKGKELNQNYKLKISLKEGNKTYYTEEINVSLKDSYLPAKIVLK